MAYTELNYSKVLIVAIMASSSWLVSFALSYLGNMTDQVAVFTAGVVCLSVVTLGVFLIFRDLKGVDPLMYIASVFSWTCMIDLGIALELDGYIKDFIGYYFAEGEPYLSTAHGTLINYWDGTVHYALYLAMILAFTNRLSYREVGLYWVGSILNSMVVLLPGAVTGEHPFKLSIFLNTPYLLLPIVAGFKLLHERPPQARCFLKFPSLSTRPIDCLFIMYFVFAACFSIFRGLSALGGKANIMKVFVEDYDPYIQDPSNFPLVQVLAYAYFFTVYYLVAIYGLVSPGQHWMADWSLLHAGAAAQGQVTYMLGAWHHRTKAQHQPPTTNPACALFWGVNIMLLVIPQLFAIYCCRDVDKFGRHRTAHRITSTYRQTSSYVKNNSSFSSSYSSITREADGSKKDS